MDDNVRLRQGDRTVFRRLAEGEGAVLLHLDTADYHGVNEMGVVIWELLEGQPTQGELLHALEERLDSPPPAWRREVADFVADLVRRGLVRTA